MLDRVVMGVCAAVLGLAALAAPAAEGKRGGTLTIGTEVDPPTLDPLQVSSYVGLQYAMAIFDTLLTIDASGRIVPGLATSHAVTTDGLLYTLKLREGVRFHDGTEFDAAAVVFNLDRARDPKNRCRCLANLSLIKDVKAADPRTVEIRLSAPMASFPAVLADSPGMMASPAAVRTAGETFGQKPVGTGPFRLVEWIKGSRFVAERNAGYWRTGRPFVDRLVFKGLQNSEAREATMRSGGFDIVTQAPPRFVAQARSDKRYQVLMPNAFGAVFIPLRMTHPQLKDQRVRLALAHATNREQLLKVMFHGLPKLATTPFGKGMHLSVDELADYPKFDPARAKALLAEFGQPVRLVLTADNTPLSLRTNQALQQMWRAVGVNVEIQVVDMVRLIQSLSSHDFDAALFRWSGRADPDLNVYSFFHSRLAQRTPSSNFVQYANPEMDELLEAGRRELNPLERRKIYSRISTLLARDLPYIFLGYTTAPLVASSKVHGMDPMPDSLVRVADAWKE
ncbi:MAG: ABC transporter substrate-binding protein [Rubrivivax sp.]